MDKKIIEYHCLKWTEKCKLKTHCSYHEKGFLICPQEYIVYDKKYDSGIFTIYHHPNLQEKIPCGEGINKNNNILLYYMKRAQYKNGKNLL
jgi:hypothetical protein